MTEGYTYPRAPQTLGHVIPAKAGIQIGGGVVDPSKTELDSRLRGNDGVTQDAAASIQSALNSCGDYYRALYPSALEISFAVACSFGSQCSSSLSAGAEIDNPATSAFWSS